jgi:two-component system response regulator RegX3
VTAGEHTALRVADVELDPAAYTVRVASHPPMALPPKELKLLYLLMKNAGSPVSTTQLREEVWPGLDPASKTLHSHIRRLRHRIEPDPHHPVRIVTVGAHAYLFADDARLSH